MKDDNLKKSYYAIIPANVRYDPRLTPNAKLLYGEITALCNEHGYCWAGNKYFSDLYGVSKTTVSKWIKSLIDFGYIKSELVYKNGTKEIDNRYITIVKDPIEEKLKGYTQKVKDPIEEKLKDNNTSLILQVNNKKDISKDISKKESVNYQAIVDAYNSLCTDLPSVRSLTDKRKRAIRARLKDYSIDDFTTAFKKAQQSDFLSGRNGKWNGANFDWLLNENNIVKVLEGNYDNKQQYDTNSVNKDYEAGWDF